VSGPKHPPPAAKRKVGLDRPCRVCGEAIYYNYKGPIDGVCGRCADRQLRKRGAKTRTRTVVVEKSARLRGVLVFLAGALAGAVAMYLAYPHLPV